MNTSPPALLGAFAAVLFGHCAALYAAPGPDALQDAAPPSRIDALVAIALLEQKLEPAAPCPDDVFFRRVHVDLIGALPEPEAALAFFEDQRPDRRARLIDDLLTRDAFADFFAMKWCDVLRVKSEFPINLWPNAVQAYHRWVRDALRDNMPYDEFARALLTSSGSNFRVPPVNFYRAVQSREPAALAAAAAQTFMGARIDAWPEARRADLAVFFSRVAYKSTAEWKEEIVFLNPVPAGPLRATFPDGNTIDIPSGADPRDYFADWLMRPNNEWFARAAVNRVWTWLMGRGIIHEPDDIRPDNPPANPALLAYLEAEFRDSGYDLKHLYRLILNSQTYQQSAVPASDNPDAGVYAACYPVRPLEAEVLCDALNWLAGRGESYPSLIPEPFTFVPEYQSTVSQADGSITSPFLEMFGRPSRDTGLDAERGGPPTDKQRLHLLNASEVQRKIETSTRLARLFREARGNPDKLIRSSYLTVLSRYPSEAEEAAAKAYFETDKLNHKQAMADLVWALVNTKEFLYRH